MLDQLKAQMGDMFWVAAIGAPVLVLVVILQIVFKARAKVKQVKQVFMTLDDATVMSYLQAMEPRAAARIMKEIKSPEELRRIQTIMERMRQATPAAAPSAAGQPPEAQAQAKE